MALKSKIEYEVDYGRSISFTDAFTSFMTEASKNRKSINPKLQSDQLFVEYYTTSEVAKSLGLTYENYYDLPTKDPNTLKKIFDLGEFVHRLINSDIYGQMAEMQDAQMKERREFRKNVLKK
jgi:hypothetical protein